MTAFPSNAESVRDHPADANLRVLGPPGSGKTTRLIERYRTLTEARDQNSIFVLTYSSASLRRLTERLVASDDAWAGVSRVMTFFSLSRDVIAASGTRPPTVIDDVQEGLVLERVIESKASRFRSDYRNIRTSAGLRRELLDLFHLFMQSGLMETEKRRKLMEASDDVAVSDVFMLYDGFIDALDKKGLATFYDIAWRAAGVAQSSSFRHPLESARTILVDDFQDIDAGQFELLKAIAPTGGARALNVFGDPMGSFFGFRGTRSSFLMKQFPDIYGGETFHLERATQGSASLDRTLDAILVETLRGDASRYAKCAGSRPEANGGAQLSLFGPGEVTSAGDVEARTFDITVTDDEVAEAHSVASRVDAMLRAGRQCDEIAIVSNRKDKYEPLLAMAFHQWGIPLDSGWRGGDAFHDFVYAVLSMFGGSRDDVIERTLLTSPFFDLFREVCLKTNADPARNFAQVVKNLYAWADAQTIALNSERGEERVPYVVREVFMPVCERYAENSGDESTHRFVSELDRAWSDFIGALSVTGATARANVETFLRTTDLFNRTTGAPSSDEHVGFYSCRELKGLYFPVTIVLGCSELLFPSARGPSGMLPFERIQDVLGRVFPERGIQVYGARSPDEVLSEEYHLLYSSLSRSTEAVYVTAPKQFGGHVHPAPSAILARNVCEKKMQSHTVDVMPPVVRFARAWVRSSGARKIATDLAPLNRIGPAWPLDRPKLEVFSLPPFSLSKTSIETYIKCPRRFFYRRILKVPEDESVHLKLGSLFHVVMHDLGEQFPTKDRLHAGATDSVIDAAIAAALEAETHIEKGTFVADAMEHHIASMVRGLLWLDRQESDAYDVRAVEEPLSFESGGWKFNGKIDRIEKTPGGEIIITDYKTGGFNKMGSTLRKRVLATLDEGENSDWQVPIYLSGYRDKDRKRATAFKHYVVQPGEDPFHIKLFVGATRDELPPEAAGGGGKYKRYSHVLTSELEDIMDVAESVAGQIFGEREGFPKTEIASRCRNCFFTRLCGREA